MTICEFCGKTGFKQFKNHVRQCPKNPEAKPSHKGHPGRNHYSYGGVMSEETKGKLSRATTEFNKTYWTDEQRIVHSETMKKVVEQNPDSYSHLRGGRKRYKDYFIDSEWEKDTIIYFEEKDIVFERECGYFKYMFEGVERKYFPDFFLPEFDVFVEVKGYKTSKDVAKWEQFPKRLLIVDGSNILKVQNLTLDKDFWRIV